MCYQNKNEPIVFNGTPIRHRQRLSRAKKVKSTFKHFCFSKAINYFHLFFLIGRQTDGRTERKEMLQQNSSKKMPILFNDYFTLNVGNDEMEREGEIVVKSTLNKCIVSY